MAKPVQATEELLDKLLHAQMKHTARIITDPYNRFGDDWGDDTNAALSLAQVLFEFAWDQCDLEGLDAWLNTPYDENAGDINVPVPEGRPPRTLPQLGNIGGCDGYCNELYELDCPALPKDR